MKDVIIKEIPHNESYLFSKKLSYMDRSIIGTPSFKTVKFVITDEAVYVKIANVLIDTSGGIRLQLNEIERVELGKYMWQKKLKFYDKMNNSMTIVDKEESINMIINVLQSKNIPVTIK